MQTSSSIPSSWKLKSRQYKFYIWIKNRQIKHAYESRSLYISKIYDKDHRELHRNTFSLVILGQLGMHIRMRFNHIL